jgi:hypothetical protein
VKERRGTRGGDAPPGRRYDVSIVLSVVEVGRGKVQTCQSGINIA